MAVTAVVRTITPQDAKKILKSSNHPNRTLRKARTYIYADDMKNGNWLMTGEPIIMDDDNNLLNGQHRLEAVVLSEIPQDFILVRGIDKKAFIAMDSGQLRTPGDMLTISGIVSGTQQGKPLGVACSYAITYALGIPRRAATGPQITKSGNIHRAPNDSANLVAYAKKHPAVVKSVNFTLKLIKGVKPLLPIAVVAWVHYETTKIDADLADKFVMSFVTGSGLRAGDAVSTLREACIENKTARQKHHHEDILAGIVKAWNWKRTGKRQHARHLFAHDWDKTFPRFS